MLGDNFLQFLGLTAQILDLDLQAAMAKLLKIPVTSVNRQIRALAKRNLIEADTGGGITFLTLVSDPNAVQDTKFPSPTSEA